jgi:HD-like signal output (HDOD) protein
MDEKLQSVFDVVIEQVPTLPFVVTDLMEVTRSDTFSADYIGEIIEDDQTLAGKTLKLAKSPFYCRSGQISNIRDAIVLMGPNAVKNMALSLSVRDLFHGKNGQTGFDLESFWLHSLACALCARDISKYIKASFSEEALLCGMLHDVGKAFLNQYLPQQYRKVIQCITSQKMSIAEAEETIFGVNHAVVGSWVLKIWRFPKLVTDGIRLHHEFREQSPEEDYSVKLSAIVNLCDTIVRIHKIGSGGDEISRDIDMAKMEPLGLTGHDVSRIAIMLNERIWETANSIGFSVKRETCLRVPEGSPWLYENWSCRKDGCSGRRVGHKIGGQVCQELYHQIVHKEKVNEYQLKGDENLLETVRTVNAHQDLANRIGTKTYVTLMKKLAKK